MANKPGPVCRIPESFGERQRDELQSRTNREGRALFPGFLEVLENARVTIFSREQAGGPACSRTDRSGLMDRTLLRRRLGRPVFAEAVLVPLEPTLQDGDGAEEVIAERPEQVDVVEVLFAREAVGRLLRGLTVARISPQPGQRKR